MRFGKFPVDVPEVVAYARRLYRACRAAGGEYIEISREVRSLHTVLRHLKCEVQDSGSVLNGDSGSGGSLFATGLALIVDDCDRTLRQLDGLLQKYGRPDGVERDDGRQPGRARGKPRFGSAEKDELGSIRMKLISHNTNLTQSLDKIQLGDVGQMSSATEAQTGQPDAKLDTILAKVHAIAAKMGGQSSLMTTNDDDDTEAWKQFRRELVAEGFSDDVLQQHKDVLRAYIRQIDQDGQLDQMPPAEPRQSASRSNSQQLLGSPQSPSDHGPPSFSSLNVQTDTTLAKELVVPEDNLKSPQFMKPERLKPETALAREEPPYTPTKMKNAVASKGIEAETPSSHFPGVLPKNYNTGAIEKYQSTSSVLTMSTMDLLLASECKPKATKPSRPSIQDEPSSSTSNALTQAIPLPNSKLPRSPAHRPPAQLDPEPASGDISPQFKTSPSNYSISRHGFSAQSVPRSPWDGDSSRPSRLGPDSYGREIPLDALWTKVKRSIVSTEVLDQDGRRYEARPDFVAILGTLSREEIEAYAIRSRAVRHARAVRAQQPRPSPRPEQPRWRDDDSSSEEDEYSPDIRPSREYGRTYPGASIMPPPLIRGTSTEYNYDYDYDPPRRPSSSQQPYAMAEELPTRRRQNEADRYRERSRDLERDREKPRRRLGGLTAAGIGGAAASLLAVLSEAAEGF